MPSDNSHRNSGATSRPTALVCSHQWNSTPMFPTSRSGPADQTEPGHAARDEAGRVHQVAEDQPVPKGDDEPGPEQNVQSLSAARETERSAAPGESCRKLT